jgi:hypothetical protein
VDPAITVFLKRSKKVIAFLAALWYNYKWSSRGIQKTSKNSRSLIFARPAPNATFSLCPSYFMMEDSDGQQSPPFWPPLIHSPEGAALLRIPGQGSLCQEGVKPTWFSSILCGLTWFKEARRP